MLAWIACCEDLRSLSELRWKARIVLCKSDAPLLNTFLAKTALEKEELDERDIVYFVIAEEQLVSNYKGTLSSSLREEIQTRLKQESKAVVLIGKDGDVKGKYPSLCWAEIFAVIDAMPMRQQEQGK